jgi:hypothetical protein
MLTKRVSAIIGTAQGQQVECPACHNLVSKNNLVPKMDALGSVTYVCTACYVEKN